MKVIQTSGGHAVKVCDCHYDLVSEYKWSAFKQGRHEPFSYAAVRVEKRNGKSTTILMHREIMGFPVGLVVDHIDGNPSNNRCNNLRICTQAQNSLNNRKAKHNSVSGYKGIYWHKAAQKWCAEVVFNRQKYYLGVFKNKLDAIEAYNDKAKELHGQFFAKS